MSLTHESHDAAGVLAVDGPGVVRPASLDAPRKLQPFADAVKAAGLGQNPQRRPPSVLDIVNQLDPAGRTAASPPPPPSPRSSSPSYSTPDHATARARAIEYLADCEPAIQGQHGSAACLWACRVAVWGFALGEDDGYDVVAAHYNPRCEPQWSEAELRKKCRDAADPHFKHARGWLLDKQLDRAPAGGAGPARPVPTFGPLFGSRPSDVPPPSSETGAELADPIPATTPPLSDAGQGGGVGAESADMTGVDPTDPYRLARGFIRDHFYRRHDDTLTLKFWDGRFAKWKGGAYVRLDDSTVRAAMLGWAEADFQRLHAAAMKQHASNEEKGAPERKPPQKVKASRAVVSDSLAAVEQLCRIPDDATPPCWIGDGPPPAELVACRNGLVHVPAHLAGRAGAFIPATPRFVSCVRTEFDFNPAAPTPTHWLAFLADIWEGDRDSVACLQEWFGYLLTPDTSLHKMLMIVGPPRAGKGTIGRVLRALVGGDNCAAPTLGKLGDRFALADLLDKTVAIFADAHLSGRADAVAITEELLSISGEDARTVDLKFKAPITTTLRTRFVFFSNELPRFGDSSGAIVSRFVFLRLTKSFVDHEDKGLLGRLLPELPGILLWAMAGWQRLCDRGAFTVPASAQEMRQDADALAAPVKVWAAECCAMEADCWELTDELFKSWQGWCQRTGRDRSGSREHFVRDMLAALPSLRRDKRPFGTTRKWGYAGIRLLSATETDGIPV